MRPKGLSLKRAAENNPLAWASSLKSIAQLAGYHDKHEVEHSGEVLHKVQSMSDVELQSQLADLQRELEAQKAITTEYEEEYEETDPAPDAAVS